MSSDIVIQPLKVGNRVVVKRIKPRGGAEFGGCTGTILCLPGKAQGVPPNLYVIKLDDGTVHGIDEMLLEPCA